MTGVSGRFDPVYPRWRGEHEVPYRRIIQINGLSPLARGTHKSYDENKNGLRFIPAGAGNTG